MGVKMRRGFFALVAGVSAAVQVAVELTGGGVAHAQFKYYPHPATCPKDFTAAFFSTKDAKFGVCLHPELKKHPCPDTDRWFLTVDDRLPTPSPIVHCSSEACDRGLIENPVTDHQGRLIKSACVPSEFVRFPRTGTLRPSYYVLTLIYSPPGNNSSVDYSSGSTSGSSIETKALFKAGITATATLGPVEAETTVFGGAGVGSVLDISKESNQLMSAASRTDKLDHEKDTFYLWINPMFRLTETKPGDISVLAQTANNGSERMKIVPVTVAQLRNPASLPADKKKALAGLTPEDYKNILALNPLAAAGATPDPKRYTKLSDSLQIDGPDNETDDVLGRGLDVGYAESAASLGVVVAGASATVTVGAEFSLFGAMKAGFKAGPTFEFELERTSQTSVGKTQSAAVKLASSTVGYHRVYRVYYDAAFKTFAFVEVAKKNDKPPKLMLSGTVTQKKKPLADQEVAVSLPDGSLRRVRTNARGRYQLFDLPPGEQKVKVASQQRSVKVAPETEAEGPVPTVDVDVDVDPP